MTQMYSANVKTVADNMARSTTDVHAFKIFMDEPPELGGRNAAPSPLDFILAAHAGCLNYMTFFIAKQLGIKVTGTEIEIAASLNPAKFAGTDMTARAGYQALDVTIKVSGPGADEDISRLLAEVESRCPVSDNLANATPIHIRMTAQ